MPAPAGHAAGRPGVTLGPRVLAGHNLPCLAITSRDSRGEGRRPSINVRQPQIVRGPTCVLSWYQPGGTAPGQGPASVVRSQVPRRVRHVLANLRRDLPCLHAHSALMRCARFGERGVTQRKLAAEIGRDFTTVSQYETGRCAPSLEALATIADVLDTPVTAFIKAAA